MEEERKRTADLPGQMTLFPEPASGGAGAECREAAGVLLAALPNKATATVPEAAAAMGVSDRTVAHWIEDGTLLAAYADRRDGMKRRNARVVVRAGRPYDPARRNFLTLEELRVRRSNVMG